MERQTRFWHRIFKKCRIKNVYSIIVLTLVCGKYFLLMPYSTTPDHRLVMNRREHIVFSAVLAICNSIVVINSFLELRPEDQNNPYALLGFTRHVFIVLYTAMMTVVVIAKAPAWAELLNSISEWDTLLPLSSKLMVKLTSTVLIQFTYFALKSTLNVYLAFTAQANRDPFYYLNTLLSSLTIIFCEGRVFNIIYSLAWINVYFVAIDEEIRSNLLDENRDRNRAWEHMCVPGLDKTHNGYKIKRLRFFYGKLMDMKDTINEHYSFQILITIASIFFDMVFLVFLAITIFQYRNHIELDSHLINKFHRVAIITLTQVTKLVMTVFLCENIKTKGSGPPIAVHKALHTAYNFEEKSELLTFSLEVLHRSARITAGGFFGVDYELLHTIMAAVTVYTIMIIQFNFKISSTGENPVESLCKFV